MPVHSTPTATNASTAPSGHCDGSEYTPHGASGIAAQIMLPVATTGGSVSAKRAFTVRALNAYRMAAISPPANAAMVMPLSVTLPKRASVTTPKMPTTTPTIFDVDGRVPAIQPISTVNRGTVELSTAE